MIKEQDIEWGAYTLNHTKTGHQMSLRFIHPNGKLRVLAIECHRLYTEQMLKYNVLKELNK